MAANADTKLQVNLKTPGGALINVYATDEEELKALLRVVYSNAQAITSTEALLAGAQVVQSTVNTPPTAANTTPAPAPSPLDALPSTPSPSCKHGQMTYRENKPGAAKKWKAYMCPAPKSDPSQCEPQWIR